MCGIAGVYKREFVSPDEMVLKGMLSVMAHRGPDDSGIHLEPHLALGHRRLSIIDTSPAGHQPMLYKDLVIVYNGEVYNYLEIRKELELLGHIFHTGTDTEVILHSYEEWGEKCLLRFTGMWAFAILNKEIKKLFCSRDRFGIKPFYYYRPEKRIFLFASEIKALLSGGAPAHPNYERLMDYLVVGIEDHSQKTFFQGIRQLKAGHSLSLDLQSGEMRTDQYYGGSLLSVQTIEEFAASLRRSVQIHLRSDVPVGTCLSGGIDSSIVAALAADYNRKNGNDRFAAVTAQSEFPQHDETTFARKVVKHCHLQWHVTKPTYEDFKENIERCLWFQEEPVGGPSVFMQYWVMKTAREAGLKVMLDGQGGDELMLGYERYYIAFFWYLLRQGRGLSMLREYLLATRNSKLTMGKMLPLTLYFLIPALRKKVLRKRVHFLKKEYTKRAQPTLHRSSSVFFDIGQLQISEIYSHQLPHLLKYEDRNSMAHSIEARVPYIEVACVEAALHLPPECKIRGGFTKYPLRKIAETILPSEIAWRKKKIGFEAPTAIWLKKQRPVMEEAIRRSRILQEICQVLPTLETLGIEMQWRLYNIALWERLFNIYA